MALCSQPPFQNCSLPARIQSPINRIEPKTQKENCPIRQLDQYPDLASYFREPVTLSEGARIHAHIIGQGLIGDLYLGNRLVSMYGSCGAVVNSRSVFDKMEQRDVVSWNAMIAVYAHHEHDGEAIQLFWQMLQEGVQPNKVSFLSVLRACATWETLEEGKAIHQSIIDCGLESDVGVGTALFTIYGKCGALEDARAIFNKMQRRNVVSWNAMISSYAQHGHSIEALELFQVMQQEGLRPNKITFASVLSACASLTALADGEAIHKCIIDFGFESDVTVGNAIINMYGKCGAMDTACKTFKTMCEHNVESWNAIITAYVQHGHSVEALHLFRQMQQSNVEPDKITCISILGACTSMALLAEGKVIHKIIAEHAFQSDVLVANALIRMYGKCGSTKEARTLFNEMHHQSLISWNTMLSAYTQHGQGKEALLLFQQMQHEGLEPDEVTFVGVIGACAIATDLTMGKHIHERVMRNAFDSNNVVQNALVNMYGKCGAIEEARNLFDTMKKCDVASWNAMITAYTQHENDKEVLQLFLEMQHQDIEPDMITFVSVLGACACLAALAEGKAIHAYMLAGEMELDTVGIALVNMYSKCGTLEDAQSVFDRMQQHDVISWNVIISAYCKHGCGKKAMQLFQQMQQEGVEPDEVTFIGILTACSHTGLVNEGRYFFISMVDNYGITPTQEHYSCMIDLLGRAGLLDEAEDFISRIPLRPDACIWKSFIAACRIHGDAERGRRAANSLFYMASEQAASYVLLSNMHVVDYR